MTLSSQPCAFVLLATLSFLATCQGASVSSSPSQTFNGIGGSGAWWPTDLFNFPDDVRQNLSTLLFDQSGMGLSSYRYNIGSGGVNVSNPTRAIQSFWVSQGVYNWDADPSGVYFMQQAAQHNVPSITAFVNSAPAVLTSGHASCNGDFVTGTGNEYGQFVADVVSHWRGQGINITRVSPMNEPDSTFGPSPCGQEGMAVAPSQRAEVVNGLYQALENNGLTGTVGIIVDESNTMEKATSEYSAWLPQVKDKVSALCHHTYEFPSDSEYTSFVQDVQANYPGIETWMSEICCSLGEPDGSGKGYGGGYDPTITNALMFSGMVFQSLVLAGEPHYDFWTLVSNAIGCSPGSSSSCNPSVANSNGWTDGLIYYDSSYASNGNHNLYLTKHFWTYKHFGNFVKPGSQRRAITGDGSTETMMAVTDSSNYYVLAMNTGTSSTSLSLTFPETVCGTAAVRTSSSEDFASIGAATQSNGAWTLPLNALSLTTFTFKKGSC